MKRGKLDKLIPDFYLIFKVQKNKTKAMDGKNICPQCCHTYKRTLYYQK